MKLVKEAAISFVESKWKGIICGNDGHCLTPFMLISVMFKLFPSSLQLKVMLISNQCSFELHRFQNQVNLSLVIISFDDNSHPNKLGNSTVDLKIIDNYLWNK